jgi:hypothetical protein
VFETVAYVGRMRRKGMHIKYWSEILIHTVVVQWKIEEIEDNILMDGLKVRSV